MVSNRKRKINKRYIRRAITAVYCLVIALCVSVVMFCFYEPGQNALGALATVCMDMICMIILLILIGSIAIGKYEGNRSTKLFALLMIATLWATFLDFLNWAFDGSLTYSNYTYWFTLGSLCMGSVLVAIFSVYLCNYMKEMYDLSQMIKTGRIFAIVNGCAFVLTFILAITGTAFTFVDGHYETGALYDAVTVIPVLSVLVLIGYFICYYKVIGLHDILVVAGYMLFMVIGALIETEYRIGTTYVSVTIADIFVFVMLQNEIIAREKRNVAKYIRMSHTDELTGFNNRHAYEEELTKLEESSVSNDFVYVSFDVNGLKTVNDQLGHTAGDELLVGAAETLKSVFGPYGKLYRTGGDEFVALIHANMAVLGELKAEITEETENWSGNLGGSLTISCGYVTKLECNDKSVRDMAILADKRMYEAKTLYYKNSGIERRKNNK